MKTMDPFTSFGPAWRISAADGRRAENVSSLHNLYISIEWSLESIDSRLVKNICKISRQIENKKGGVGGAWWGTDRSHP
jgi:hypothetical protein